MLQEKTKPVPFNLAHRVCRKDTVETIALSLSLSLSQTDRSAQRRNRGVGLQQLLRQTGNETAQTAVCSTHALQQQDCDAVRQKTAERTKTVRSGDAAHACAVVIALTRGYLDARGRVSLSVRGRFHVKYSNWRETIIVVSFFSDVLKLSCETKRIKHQNNSKTF